MTKEAEAVSVEDMEQARLDYSAMQLASALRSSDDEPGWKWWIAYAQNDPDALAQAKAFHDACRAPKPKVEERV